MIYIPSGSFQLGDADFDDNPPQTVQLTGYWIYKNLVTVGMYKKFCAAAGVQMPPVPRFDKKWIQHDHPIVNVTWIDALACCKWAGFRLPTEAQWEEAALGCDSRKYPWGNDWDPSRCQNSVGLNQSEPSAVGSFLSGACPYGLPDMASNVWEWCTDWSAADYVKTDHGADPNGSDSDHYKLVRGGSWGYEKPQICRAGGRYWYIPTSRGDDIGFRCASGL